MLERDERAGTANKIPFVSLSIQYFHTYIYRVGINTKTAKTVLKLPKLGTFLEMYPVLAFIPVYLPKLTELIGTQ